MLLFFTTSTLLLSVWSAGAATPKILNVDYQIHSNNDLKELPQVLLKGARRFKFDPHYITSDQCGDQKSCLLLNHDNPTPQFSNYNTSTELLNFLKSDDFQRLTDGERVTVALCFKAAPDKCQNTTAFNTWLGLVDDFYLQAQSAPKQVEFILDGDAKPVNCMIGRWPKWNSVWINSDSPNDAFYSNEEANDWYRFQVLNNPENEKNWTWLATPDINYGKFSNGSYPYQLWEPDSQQDIRDYIDIYQAGELHPSGYHFAINVDISMFRLYSADYNASTIAISMQHSKKQSAAVPGCETTLSISQPLHPADSSKTGAEDTNPLLVQIGQSDFLSVAVRAGKDIVLTAVTVDKAGYKAATHADVVLPTEASQWLLADQGDDVSLVYAASGCDSLLVMNSAGRVMQVAYELRAGEISVLATQQTSLPAELLVAPVHHLMGQDLNVGIEAETSWYALTASSALTLSGLQSSNDNSLGQMVFTTQFSATLNAPATDGEITSAKMVYLDDASTASMVIFCAQGLTVYATELTLADIDVTAATGTVQNILKWQTVSVGKNIQLSTSGSGGSDRALLLVTDSGYCYNSHGHNTRAYPMVCASTPVPTETVLDYSLGLTAHWLDAIRCTTSSASTTATAVPKPVSGQGSEVAHIATSCSSTILHGSYSQGHRPAVALDAQSQPGAYFFLETHEGVPTSAQRVGSRGGGECGDPIHHDGLVLNSFEIASWLDNVKRFYNVGAV